MKATTIPRALEQAELLRNGRAGDADLRNVAEELTDWGREEFHKLESAYRVLLLHVSYTLDEMMTRHFPLD